MTEENSTKSVTPHANYSDERDAIRNLSTENGLHSLVFYGSEPWIALVNRDKAPPTGHALPNERIAIVEWAADEPGYPVGGWAVSITTAGDRHTNPDWELPEGADESFEDRKSAVEYAAKQL